MIVIAVITVAAVSLLVPLTTLAANASSSRHGHYRLNISASISQSATQVNNCENGHGAIVVQGPYSNAIFSQVCSNFNQNIANIAFHR
jgi:hypothetical protein